MLLSSLGVGEREDMRPNVLSCMVDLSLLIGSQTKSEPEFY